MSALHPLAGSVAHPSPHRRRAAPWMVVAGLFAAPVSWSMQLFASYVLSGDRCHDLETAGPGGVGTGSGLTTALGVVAIAVCSCGFWFAYRTWRLTRGEAPGDHHEALTAGNGRTRFLGLCGMIASPIFIIAALVLLLVPLLESPCINVPL